MGTEEKANYTVIHHIGAGKERTGTMTGGDDLSRDGQHERPQAEMQEAGERAKDAARQRADDFGQE